MTRLVWLFLFINVYWWGSIGTSSSTLPPLLNKGKFSAISWMLTQISNSEFLILSFYVLMDLFLIGVSLAIFFLLYYINNKIKNEVNNILKFFFDLPIMNKLFLFGFTISFGIPNRIFVNHGINSYLMFFILTCLFFITDELPLVTLALVFYFFLALESVLFAYLYKNSVNNFQKFINTYLFASNREFAKKYFNFFFGNMDRAGKAAIKTGGASWLIKNLWNAITGNEDSYGQTESERRIGVANRSATKETTVEEILEATRKEKARIMEDTATFTNAEKNAKAFLKDQAKKFTEHFTKSDSDESDEKKK